MFCHVQERREKALLWRVRGGARDSFLFGTVHVPYTLVQKAANNAAVRVLRRADLAFFELDLRDPHTLLALRRCQLVPDSNTNVSQLLGEKLFERIVAHLRFVRIALPLWLHALEARPALAVSPAGQYWHEAQLFALNRYLITGAPAAPSNKTRLRSVYEQMFDSMTLKWHQKRPIWLLLLLESLTPNELAGTKAPPLDLYLAHEAASHSVHTGGIERVTEQCEPLNSMALSDVFYNFYMNSLHF